MASVPSRSDLAVLLVEDEPLVRLAGQRTLESIGYRWHVAANGHEALNLLDAEAAIGVMVTDLHLPGMNGRQLAEQARRRHPHLQIILATGSEPEPDEQCSLPLLRKPYLEVDLAKAIDDVMAG